MKPIIESSRTGARRAVFDRQFMALASAELKSSLSKTAMINRVREFLPQLRPSAFTKRGTSGIRSSVIDRTGKFVPDTLVVLQKGDSSSSSSLSSVHLLNYNSPGATGALPMASMIASQVLREGLLEAAAGGPARSLWDAFAVADSMEKKE